MVNLSRDTYPQTVLYSGVTTSSGNVGATTLLDSVLVSENDFLSNATIIIMSGVCHRETRLISTFSTITGTITVGTAFSAQIVSGVSFVIIGRLSTATDLTALQADIGDASASTLNSIYGILGNPAVAISTTGLAIKAKTDLIPADITAQLDTNVPAIKAKTDLIGASVGTSTLSQVQILSDTTPFAGADIGIIKGTMLKTFEKAVINNTSNGSQDIVLATATTQACIIESVIIHAIAAQPAQMTSCAIYAGAGKVITCIDSATAILANLNAEDKQILWTGTNGAFRLATGKTIVMTLVGTGVAATNMVVSISYRAATSGGTLQ